MTTELVDNYLRAVQSALMAGNATEHTYRSALQTLLEGLGGRDITATNEPKRKKYGAPDYQVTRQVSRVHERLSEKQYDDKIGV